MVNKKEFTHYASMYGIPCYFNEATNDIVGRNKLYDFMLDIIIRIDTLIPTNEDGFNIKLYNQIK